MKRLLYVCTSTVIVLASCTKEEVVTESYTDINVSLSQLIVEKGNPSSDTVVLYTQGGPAASLYTDYFDKLALSKYKEVYVHQANTFNTYLIGGLNENLSTERAAKENEISADILYRVAKYFKEKNRVVVIVGHSFGAFVIERMLTKYSAVADKYLIMAGRLDMPDVVWQGLKARTPYYFKDGIEPIATFLPTTLTEKERKETYAIMQLQATASSTRYTQQIKKENVNKIIYAYADFDNNVGRLTDQEIMFINTNGGLIYRIKNGTHGSVFTSPYKEEITTLLFFR